MKKIALTAILLSLYGLSFGQFLIEAELRPRLEIRDGYKTIIPEGKNAILLVSQRSRLGLQYSSGFYTTKISFQDVRVWGEELINTQSLNIGLHEAWVEFKASPQFKVKVGRQVLSYDNQRIVGTTNWNQVGAKHDALKLSLQNDGWEMDLVGAFNQSSSALFNTSYLLFDKQYKNLGILWLKKSWQILSIANLTLVEGLRQDDISTITHTRVTSGIMAKLKIENTVIDGRVFYQGGKNQFGTKLDAYLMNFEISQEIDIKNTLLFGIESRSGNKSPKVIEAKDRAFDIPYGGKHNFNGLMDYFGVSSTYGGVGLTDIYLKYVANLNKKTQLFLDYHYYKTQADFQFEGQNLKSYLGSEVDLSCSIAIVPEINLTGIFGVMFPTSSMSAIKTNNPGYTKNGIYLATMLTFKPMLFKD